MLKRYAVGKTGKYHIVIPIWKDKASVLLFVNNPNSSKGQYLLYAEHTGTCLGTSFCRNKTPVTEVSNKDS